MRTKKLFLSAFLLFAIIASFAQTKRISGKVVSQENNAALSGVTVSSKSLGQAVTTGNNGAFSITINDQGKTTLLFSYVGYEDQAVEVTDAQPITVTLKQLNKALDDIVVVGYGTQRKRDLTGAVASVSARDLEKTPITRADQMIQGRVSGVQVVQTNAAPGGNVSIRIRGTNSINSGNEPLFVIDGFPGGGNLNSINPSDIESIEILKDASATAIYGSRGANGVVLITTKKGKAGVTTVNFDTYQGIQRVNKKYDMMNAREFATYLDSVTAQNNRLSNTNVKPNYTTEQINAMGAGTDWQDEIFRTAPIANYQLSVNGGSADARYNLSFSYFDQKGIVINSGFQRGTLRFNFDKTIGSKVRMGLTSQLSFSNENAALVNTNGGAEGGTIYNALRFNPVLGVRDSTGAYTFKNDDPNHVVDPAGNPVAYANRVTDNNKNMRTLLTAFAEYEVIKGLKLRFSAGTDLNYYTRDFYIPSTLYETSLNPASGTARKDANTDYNWVNENTIAYDRKINDNHSISAVGGVTFQMFKNSRFNDASSRFFTDQLGTNNLSIGSTPLVPFSSAAKNTLASYFGRINYRLMEKYLFTFTMRADGSSRFGAGSKWGYFPSGAFAWRMADEKFIKDLNVFSDLKLRLGYGVTGNQEIGSYQSLAQYGSGSGYTLGGIRVVGISVGNIPNPNLAWESTASADLGLDIAILKNRISMTVDYYSKKTKNLLFNKFIPTSTGFSSTLINAGSVKNRGLEFGINVVAINQAKFGWNMNANISFNRNEVADLNGNNDLLSGNSSTSIFTGGGQPTSILRVGQPIGSFYGYVFQGIWQSQKQILSSGIKTAVRPGDPIYQDTNGDSLITGTDRVIIGHALPKFIYGYNTTFRYGRFSLNAFLQGVYGVDVLNENLYEFQNGFTTSNKLKSVATNSWTGEGTSNTLPRVSSVLRRGTGVTSDVLEDGTYLRIKTVSLSYDLPFKRGFIKGLNVYVTAQNLYTFTNYSGYDPEVNSYGNNSNSNNLSLNTDYNSYPSSKTYIAGLRATF